MKVKMKIKIKSKFFTHETSPIENNVESIYEHKSFTYLLQNNAALKSAFNN